MHHVRVHAFRVRSHDRDLAVDVRRVVGYQAECSCGARGRVLPSVREARSSTSELRHEPGVGEGAGMTSH